MLGRGTLAAQKNAQIKRLLVKIDSLRAERESLSGRKGKTRRKMIGRELRQLTEKLTAKGIEVPPDPVHDRSGKRGADAEQARPKVKRVRSAKLNKMTRQERFEAAKAAENSKKYARQYLADEGTDLGEVPTIRVDTTGDTITTTTSAEASKRASKIAKQSTCQDYPGIWVNNNGLGDAKMRNRLRRGAAEHGVAGIGATAHLVGASIRRQDVADFVSWLSAHESAVASSSIGGATTSIWDLVELVKVHEKLEQTADAAAASRAKASTDIRASSPYAVYARVPIKKGQVLLRIPSSACLGPHSCSIANSDKVSPIPEGVFQLAACILQERRRGKTSRWHGLLALYPKRTNSAVTWKDTSDLEGTTAAHQVEKDLQQLAKVFSVSIKPLFDSANSQPAVEFDEFRHAYSIALSYGQRLSDSNDALVIVPFIDLLNHTQDRKRACIEALPVPPLPNKTPVASPEASEGSDVPASKPVSASTLDGGFEIKATTDIAAGDEIFRDYGIQSRSDAVHRFGFTSFGYDSTTTTAILPEVFDDVFGDGAAVEAQAGLLGEPFALWLTCFDNAVIDWCFWFQGLPVQSNKDKLHLKLNTDGANADAAWLAEPSVASAAESSNGSCCPLQDLNYATRFVLADPSEQDAWVAQKGARVVLPQRPIKAILAEEYVL